MSHDPYAALPPVLSFAVTSSDFAEGGELPVAMRSRIFGAGGEDRSPALAWTGVPEGTRSFVVTMYDPDAPTVSGFWHWAVANIPGDVTSLASGIGDESGSGLPDGAMQLPNDASMPHFVGAAPPPGHGRHRYIVAVHALGVERLEGLAPTATPALLSSHVLKCTIGRGLLTGWSETPAR